MIRSIERKDAGAVADVYNYYVQHTVVTFEEEPVTAEEMKRRILDISPEYPWLVSEDDGLITGYAYATRWKARAAYRHSAEITVYLSPEHTGKGHGRALYIALLHELRQMGIHAVIGGVALPNEASIHLHEALGFVKTAHFKEVGFKLGRWVDVAYWQLIL